MHTFVHGIVTFDRNVFLITKQLRVETVEHFYGKLKELAKNCDLENKEETLIGDVFITSLIDPEFQNELLKQTVEPRQALELAINKELGMHNLHQFQQHNKTLIPASVNAFQYPPSTRSSNWSLSINFHKQGIPRSIAQTVVEIGSQITGVSVLPRAKHAKTVVC